MNDTDRDANPEVGERYSIIRLGLGAVILIVSYLLTH